jgi:cobalt-zinc-cadmium resistance protein CzcA
MISRLIRESFHAPLLTALLVAAGTVIGAFWLQDLPRDVFPDLSAPVFNVITQNAAMGAEELETAIAIPLEVALAGFLMYAVCGQFPAQRRPRSRSSSSRTDYCARGNSWPSGCTGERATSRRHRPRSSQSHRSIERIFEFTLEAEPGAADLMTLRDLAEFEVNNRLVAVPGVAAVERLGGYLRQFQVQLDPERMSARRISLDDVMHAIEESNLNASGGIVAQGSIEWTVRALGRAHTVDDLRRTVVTVRGDVPVLLVVADIREAALPPPPRVAHRLKARLSARTSSSSSA